MKKIWIVFICFITTCFSNENGYVSCNFQGQLGNQMFQVAAAIGYALDHGCKAIFPSGKQAVSGISNFEYVFHRLNTEYIPEKGKYTYYESHNTSNVIYKNIPYEKGRYICLDGGYQSPKYFERHEKQIREIFAPSEELRQKILKKYKKLLKGETVALHLRTFIPDGRVPLVDGLGGATWTYFLEAMDQFPKTYTFLVFSDDIKWVRENFPPTDKRLRFIGENPYWIDFYLMSMCKHQIVSPESTFSWWAAWLNENPNKKVIIPHLWASNPNADLLLSDWIKIPLR